MGFLRKIRSIFHENWCNLCQSEMEVMHKQLYALPDVTVGHYSSHESPEYYRKHLVPAAKKAEIPAGIYACGLHAYRCPQCGHRRVQLTVFLPVREEEKTEEILFFDHGELDDLIYRQDFAGSDVKQKNRRRQNSYESRQGGFYDYE